MTVWPYEGKTLFRNLCSVTGGVWSSMVAPFLFPLPATPIVVFGNQKSGTTVIATLLAELGGLTRTIDIPVLWPPRVNKVIERGQGFARTVRKNPLCFAKELIKEPNLTFLLPQVKEYFPRGRFLFVVRDPRDNVRSLLDRVGLPGDLSALDETHHIPPPWGLLFASEGWGINCDMEDPNYVELLACRWNKCVEMYLQYNDMATMVRYEDFVSNKIGTISQLAKKLGVRAKKDISAKLDKQYQRKGDRRNWPWKRFFGTENLLKIEKVCDTYMNEMGYSPITDGPLSGKQIEY